MQMDRKGRNRTVLLHDHLDKARAETESRSVDDRGRGSRGEGGICVCVCGGGTVMELLSVLIIVVLT